MSSDNGRYNPDGAPLGDRDEQQVEDLEVRFILARRQGAADLAGSFVLDYLPLAREAEDRLRTAAVLLDELNRSRGGAAAAGGYVSDAERTVWGDAASRELLAPDLPESIGRFSIVDRLGAGAFGTVYWAYDPKYDRDVALKVLHAAPAYRHEEAEVFKREARTAAKLRHPNVVGFYESGEDGGRHYLAAQLVCGENLEERLAREPRLAPREAAELVRKVALGLAYAHQKGIVHCDVKPSNILLDEAGEPLVADFGLARKLGVEASIGPDGQPFGTIPYMPPEQLEGRLREVDQKSDVYSLGVVLYRLLTGRLPIKGANVHEQLAKVKEGGFPAVRSVAADVARDLETICHKALAVEPGRRFASATALAEELWRWRNGEPLTIRRPTLWEKTRGWARRNRVRAWGVTAAVVMFVVGGVASAATYHFTSLEAADEIRKMEVEATRSREERAAAEALAKLEKATRRELQVRQILEQAKVRLQTPVEGRARGARELLRLAGGPLADVPERAREGLRLELRFAYGRTLAVPDLQPAAAGDRPALPISMSTPWPGAILPDGKAIALGLPDRPVYWQRGKKPNLPKGIDPLAPRPQLGYSPDGQHLAFVPGAGGMQLWDRELTRFRTLLKEKEGGVIAFVFSADSKKLLALGRDGRLLGWVLPEGKEEINQALKLKEVGTISAASFDRTSGSLALGNTSGRVFVYNLMDNTLRELARMRGRVEKLAWAPEGQQVAAGTHDGAVMVWHLDNAPPQRFRGLVLGPKSLLFSVDGRWLIGDQRIWDVGTGEQVLHSRSGNIQGFTADGKTFVVGNAQEVVFQDLLPPEGLFRLPGHQTQVARVALAANGKRFASMDNRTEIRVWELAGPANAPRPVGLTTILGQQGGAWAAQGAIALSHDGSLLAHAGGGMRESHVRIYDAATGKERASWKLPGGFEYLAATGNGTFRLVREQGVMEKGKPTLGTVVLDLEVGKPLKPGRLLRANKPDEQMFLSAGLTPDGQHYMWVGPRFPNKHRVEVWNVTTGKLVSTVPVSESRLEPGAYLSPDGKSVWTQQPLEKENTAAIWRHDLTGAAARVKATALPVGGPVKGDVMVYGFGIQPEDTHGVAVWRAGRRWLDLPVDGNGHPSRETTILSPDGRFLLYGENAGTVWFADLAALDRVIGDFEKSLAKE